MLWPGPEKSIIHLDPAAGLTDGNLWRDTGPYGLHLTPVGYAAPNYGISIGPSGAPRIVFDGATQSGTVPLRFYQAANLPTNAITVAVVARHTNPTAGDRIFYCQNAGVTAGIYVQYASVDRLGVTVQDGASVCYVFDGVGATQLAGRTRVSVYSLQIENTTDRLSWQDGDGVAVSAAATGTAIDYDDTVVPTVGCTTGGGGQFFDGDLYFFGIWPLRFTDSEARAFSRYWRDRV